MKKLLGTVGLLGTLVIPGAVEAQTVVGGMVGYHVDMEALGLGAFVGIPAPQLHENISINPSFVFYFPDAGSAFEVNGDVVFRFPLEGNTSLVPFALGGINIFRTSVDIFGTTVSSTNVGLNLGGGLIFPMESFNAFVAGKFEIQDGTGFLIVGGVGFPVGS